MKDSERAKSTRPSAASRGSRQRYVRASVTPAATAAASDVRWNSGTPTDGGRAPNGASAGAVQGGYVQITEQHAAMTGRMSTTSPLAAAASMAASVHAAGSYGDRPAATMCPAAQN